MSQIKPPTIADVAARAGVSIATVSKFVNRQKSFSPAVEDRVRAAVADLGYRGNPAARSVVTGQTLAVGLAARNLHHTNVIRSANRVALSEGYSLLVVDMEEQPDKAEPVVSALATRVDGLIVSSRIPDRLATWLRDTGRHVVYMGWPPAQGVTSIRTDGRLAAVTLGTHLIHQGCRRIAYLGFARMPWSAERQSALGQAADASNATLAAFDAGEMTVEAGEAIAARVLLSGEKFDAVVGCNDRVAIGFMLQARALGFDVPGDLCIAGFDNIEPSRYLGLTTIDMCSEYNGERAMRRLIAQIKGHPNPDDAERTPFLVARDTTRRLRPAGTARMAVG